ncbi:TraM recognition domain-containing protein [Embleya scabrispora]|uniref:TraM recognition domain-containing protein n=1 Tax=Embleya scabrispora TaxID=159449 RepID=UPI0013752937|nr:TraM recognition domain-containing protein [Embleya scabrispora]
MGVVRGVLWAFHLLVAQVGGLMWGLLYFGVNGLRLRRTLPVFVTVASAAWVVIRGPFAAFDSAVAGPRELCAAIVDASVGSDPGWSSVADLASTRWSAWLRGQVPLAVCVGSFEASVHVWLIWLNTDEWRLPEPRRAVWVVLRSRVNEFRLRSARTVPRGATRVGVDDGNGRILQIPDDELTGHALVFGGTQTGKTTTCLQFARSFILRGLPFVGLDLKGEASVVDALRRWAAEAGRPFRVVSFDGPDYYEPYRHGDCSRRAELLVGSGRWAGAPDYYRNNALTYYQDVFAVLDATGNETSAGSLLGDLVELGDPAVLATRAATIPASHPEREDLLRRVAASTELVRGDSAAISGFVTQLRGLDASALGRWLRPAPGHGEAPGFDVDLFEAVDERGDAPLPVVMFSLASGVGQVAAGALGTLIVQDITTMTNELIANDRGVTSGLVWIDEFSALGGVDVEHLLARGAASGLRVLLSTQSLEDLAIAAGTDAAAGRVLDVVGMVILHRTKDPASAERLARTAGTRVWIKERRVVEASSAAMTVGARGGTTGTGMIEYDPQSPVLRAGTLQAFGRGEFALISAAGPQRRVIPRARTIPAAGAARPAPTIPTTAAASVTLREEDLEAPTTEEVVRDAEAPQTPDQVHTPRSQSRFRAYGLEEFDD